MEGKNKGKGEGEDKEERKVKEVLSKSSIREAGKGGRFKGGILGNKGLVGMGEVREKLRCRG